MSRNDFLRGCLLAECVYAGAGKRLLLKCRSCFQSFAEVRHG